MNKIFLSSTRNDDFAYLRGNDLCDLLSETENFFLEYRDTLNLPSDVTFGTEIEYEDVSKRMVDEFVNRHMNNWYSGRDSSLDSGGEVSSPILVDNLETWKQLKNICEYLSSMGADTSNMAGGHIHVGAHILGDNIKTWRKFVKLYILYEGVIFRFAYGDKISARKGCSHYAPPFADYLYGKLSRINSVNCIRDLYDPLVSDRNHAIYFDNVYFSNIKNKIGKNTIEFRCPNASTNEVIWQNNINAFTKMLVSSRNGRINEDFLDYKLEHEYIPYLDNEYR